MAVPNFMSKAGSYQDLGRGHYVPLPRDMIRQKYPGAARAKNRIASVQLMNNSFLERLWEM